MGNIFLLQCFSRFVKRTDHQEQCDAKEYAERKPHLAGNRNFTLERECGGQGEIAAEHATEIVEKLVGVDPDDAFGAACEMHDAGGKERAAEHDCSENIRVDRSGSFQLREIILGEETDERVKKKWRDEKKQRRDACAHTHQEGKKKRNPEQDPGGFLPFFFLETEIDDRDQEKKDQAARVRTVVDAGHRKIIQCIVRRVACRVRGQKEDDRKKGEFTAKAELTEKQGERSDQEKDKQDVDDSGGKENIVREIAEEIRRHDRA